MERVRKRGMSKYTTCAHCGIVERGNHSCPYKPKRKPKENTEIRRFRNSQAWIKKSAEIKLKAKHLCEVCMDNKYNTINQFNFKDLETHHIDALCEDFNRRLDNTNLVVLCQYHHKLAEKGGIPKAYLFEIAEKREGK